VKRIVRGVTVLLLAGLAVGIPSAAWASASSTGQLIGALGGSSAALEQELHQAALTGLSPSEYSRLAYELRGVKDPYDRPSWWTARSFYRGQLARSEAARISLRESYTRELALARGGLVRSLRGFADLVEQAGSRGIEVNDFAEEVSLYRGYAAEASTITEFRDIAAYLAPKGDLVRQRVAEYNREEESAREALLGARQALAEAGRLPNLRLGGFASAIDESASAISGAHAVADLQRAAERLRDQQGQIRELLDMRATASSSLEQAEATLRRAQEAKVDTQEAAAAIARLRGWLAEAGTYDAFSNIAWRLGQQKQALADAIWLATQPPAPSPGSGKFIDISLSRQQLIAYQDGQVVVSTVITTGQPALPTPPGSYRIMAKYSPFRFVSPWPYGSPYWYEASWVSYAMLFRSGGYFIHDAPWRSIWGRPGVSGSHGCVNIPGGAMPTLWAFAEIGTPVVVHW